MKILVLGSYYSDNLGDGVICDCVAEQLKELYPQAEVQIYDVLHRSCFRRESGVTMELLTDRRRHLIARRFVSRYGIIDKQYKSSGMRLADNRKQVEGIRDLACDLAVFAGGQLLMDSYALILAAYLKIFDEKGIPVILHACGTGPSVSAKTREELRKALSLACVKYISCRDDAEQVDRYYRKEKKTVKTCDPALWSAEVYGIRKEERRAEAVLGLGIMYPDTEKISPRRAMRFWCRLIRLLDQKKIRWQIFTNGGISDIVFAREILKQVRGGAAESPAALLADKKTELLAPDRPEELVRVIAGFDGILSFRLHSHIIAASLGIPSVAICWDEKVRAFFEKLGVGERCCGPSVSAEEAWNRMEAALREGTDRDLVEKQAVLQKKLLFEAVQKEMK